MDHHDSDASHKLSMQDLADALGVSKSTVSLALNGNPRLSRDTRRRVVDMAARMGYKRNPVVESLMAQLRGGKRPRFQSNIGLINCSRDANPYANHTFSAFRTGIMDRAKTLGYVVDEFWLEQPDLRPQRLKQILDTRNIRGLVLIATVEPHVIHPRYTNFWDDFACGVVGVTHVEKSFPCATNDQYLTAKHATEKVIALGYRRPAMAVEAITDELLDFKFSAGFGVANHSLPARDRLPVFSLDLARPDKLLAWLKTKRPDVLITHKSAVRGWLEKAGYRIPADIGLVHLDWHPGVASWAGMNQNNEHVASAGFDLVVNQLTKYEFGPVSKPRHVLLESDWVDGETVCSTV